MSSLLFAMSSLPRREHAPQALGDVSFLARAVSGAIWEEDRIAANGDFSGWRDVTNGDGAGEGWLCVEGFDQDILVHTLHVPRARASQRIRGRSAILAHVSE